MVRDLRDVVNKIIVAIDNDPTNEEAADLASDLATFFDASVMLVYFGRLPAGVPLGPNQIGSQEIMAAASSAIDTSGTKILDRMAEVMSAHGISVSSRIVIGTGSHAIREITENEQADLVILPKWETGIASRIARVMTPSILEDATCPVLVLKGSRWMTKSKAPRPNRPAQPSD